MANTYIDFAFESPAPNQIVLPSVTLDGPFIVGITDSEYLSGPGETEYTLLLGYHTEEYTHTLKITGDHRNDLVAGLETHASFANLRRIHRGTGGLARRNH